MKPDLSKFATLEGYYQALANYWRDTFYAERHMCREALNRLEEMREVGINDETGQWYWTATGEVLGG